MTDNSVSRDDIRKLISEVEREQEQLFGKIKAKLVSLRDYVFEVRNAGCNATVKCVIDSGSIEGSISPDCIVISSDNGCKAHVQIAGEVEPEFEGFSIHVIGTLRTFPVLIDGLEAEFNKEVNKVLNVPPADDIASVGYGEEGVETSVSESSIE